jgi:hypothetical protein
VFRSIDVMRFAAALLCAVLATLSPAQEFSFPAPRVATYNEILNNSGKDVATFRYSRNSRVFIFDFPSLAQQAATFNRLSAFIVRQRAPHDRVLTEDEFPRYLEALGKTPETLSYGNNFTLGNLLVFFNIADDKGVPLNLSERALLSFLTRERLILRRTGFYQPREAEPAVLLSIPGIGPAPASAVAVTSQIRASILRHELSHAEYYVNGRYADFCQWFWREGMKEEQRNAFREFFAKSTYDTSIEDVVISEWQAYLIHTPDKAAFNAAMVGMKEDELDQIRSAFKQQLQGAGIALTLF